MIGVILAGGRASRFGSNKALAMFEGTPIVERVAQVMRNVFREVVVVTNTPQEFRFLNLPMFRDIDPYAYEGPLGGIRTVFEKTDKNRVFVSACDMPLLNPKVIQDILIRSGDACAAVPVHHRQHEYLMAVYSRKLLPEIQAYMIKGGRSLDRFLKNRPDVAWIPIDEESCVNINTQEELARFCAY